MSHFAHLGRIDRCFAARLAENTGRSSPFGWRSLAEVEFATALNRDALWRGVSGVADIAGVQRLRRLEAQNPGFLVGAGAMLGAARHHHAFAGL